MAKVTTETLEAAHVRAGRALLRMSARQFADTVGPPLTIDKVKAFEAGRPVERLSREVMIEAFAEYGLELLNGGRPGARVKDPERWRAGLAQGKKKPDRI